MYHSGAIDDAICLSHCLKILIKCTVSPVADGSVIETDEAYSPDSDVPSFLTTVNALPFELTGFPLLAASVESTLVSGCSLSSPVSLSFASN